MKVTTIVFAVVAASWTAPFLKETNSRAATKRGIEAFERGQFTEAANDLSEAAKLSPGRIGELNRGTALVAAGDFDQGMAALGDAALDPRLREQALFNRGTAMIAAHELDRAIADLEETLRINPGSMRAKRNLEIALRNKQKEESSSGGGGGDSQQQQQPGQQQPQGSSGEQAQTQQQSGTQADIEAILESVAQQEREELRRMRMRSGPERGTASW